MPAEPAFRDDKLESLVRKCIVFPADGSETRLVHMIARTVTVEDISSLKTHSRCVDLASTFGDDCRKTRVQVIVHEDPRDGVKSTYLFYYNLSPNLPINLNIAILIGVTPSLLKTKKRLFWRGDVVVMKVQPESEQIDFIVESFDADLSALGPLQKFLRDTHQKGGLERFLRFDEEQWGWYVAHYCTSPLLGSRESYWGRNAVEKEENFLQDLNELRCAIGRPSLPRPVYMKSYTERAVDLFKSTFYLRQKVTGPPKLPPELERQIFEMCALESPEFCTVLVLVARRVHAWIAPILIQTVCITENFRSRQRDKLKRFLAKLTDSKSFEYAQHIKNLAISGAFFDDEKTINDILSICTGVENLLILSSVWGLNFFKNPQAGRNLRRLTISLNQFLPPHESMPNFYHPCFANLTHLHIWDDDEDWPAYAGWESLTSLTHLAFACSGPPEQMTQLMQTLPTVRYVALGSYHNGEEYTYADPVIDNSPDMRAAWGVQVVCFSLMPAHDWEQGARGEGDFWDLVEREVERRLEEGSVD